MAANKSITPSGRERCGNGSGAGQHLQLDALRAELIDGFRLGIGVDQFVAICVRFRAALAAHFSSEEETLAAANFPGLKQHAELHQNILVEIDAALDALKASSAPQTKYALIETMETWFYQHEVADDEACRNK